MAQNGGNAAATGTAAQSSRKEHRRRMLGMINNEEFSDMSFLCKDQTHISACRLLLMSASPRLKEIVSETNSFQYYLKEIRLRDVTSSTLLFILENLYTGEMFHKWPLKTAEQACDIIRASKSFKLPQIEGIVMEHLTDKASKTKDNISRAALELSVSVQFGTRVQASPIELVRTLKKTDLTPSHLRLLSLKAFEHYLVDTKGPPQGDQEYLRFRQIILWCAIQVRPNDTDTKIAALLPDQQRAKLLVKQQSPWTEEPVDLEYFKSLGQDRREFQSLAERLLTQVDLSGTHPKLFKAVVYPLKVVPERQMIQYQNLVHNPVELTPQYKWESRSCYKIEKDGVTISKSEQKAGFARYLAPMSGRSVVYEWAITVLEWCDEVCEIGFHKDDPEFGTSSLALQPMGFSLRSTRSSRWKKWEVNRVGEDRNKWQNFVGFAGVNTGAGLITRVKFKIDMEKRNCLISVNGGEYSEEWVRLPDGIYYPAVSLGPGNHGKVHIELKHGFKKR